MIYRASSEIRGSVVFATVIVVLVFLPLFALGSVEGRLLAPLGFAYIVSLTASLVVALTVTPALCSLLLPNARSILKGHEPWLVTQLKQAYQRRSRWSLNQPAWLSFLRRSSGRRRHLALSRTGRAFLPEFNEGTLTVSAVTLPGTSLADSDNLGRGLERILLGDSRGCFDRAAHRARRTGRACARRRVRRARCDAAMKDRPKDEVLAEIRERVTLLPGMNVTVGQPISHRIDHMLSGTRANIAVKVFGDDLAMLRSLARQVEVGDEGYSRSRRSLGRAANGYSDRTRASPARRTPLDSACSRAKSRAKIQTAFVGIEVNRILEGQISFPLVVRYPETRLQTLQ